MIAKKTGTSTTNLTIFPPFPTAPASASAELIEFHQTLSVWYDDLKRVLQGQLDSTSTTP